MKGKCKFCKEECEDGESHFSCEIENTLEKKNKKTQKTKEDMKRFQKTKEGYISLMDIVKEEKE